MKLTTRIKLDFLYFDYNFESGGCVFVYTNGLIEASSTERLAYLAKQLWEHLFKYGVKATPSGTAKIEKDKNLNKVTKVEWRNCEDQLIILVSISGGIMYGPGFKEKHDSVKTNEFWRCFSEAGQLYNT